MITLDEMLALKEHLWPQVRFWDKQVEIIESVCENFETVVVAANKVGKDFVAGFVCPAALLICQAKGMTCRIVTTSVAEHHLKVLWGEIGRFLTTSRLPLLAGQGGPLVVNYQEVRLASEVEAKNPLNYLVGRVSAKDEGLAGHHADWTMFVGDEASGLDDSAWSAAQGWAKRFFLFGNPNPCHNFFWRAVRGGDVELPSRIAG